MVEWYLIGCGVSLFLWVFTMGFLDKMEGTAIFGIILFSLFSWAAVIMWAACVGADAIRYFMKKKESD
jgi:hypothetical protein